MASRKLHCFYCPSTSLIIFITFFCWLPFLLLFVECYLCLNFLYFLRFSLPLHGFNSYLYINAYQRPLQIKCLPRIPDSYFPIHLIWILNKHLNLAYLKLKSTIKSLLPSSLMPSFKSLLLCLLCLFQLGGLLFIQPLS